MSRYILEGLRVPVMAAPMFLVSSPDLVVAECHAGVIGTFPALNARTGAQLRDWLAEITSRVGPGEAPAGSTPLFAVNLIAHRTNPRFDEGLAAVVDHRVPLVIASLGGRPEVAEAVHSYGGIVVQDVGTNRHAQKAVDSGADVLLAIAAGAGGHTGAMSPFALVAEIRQWFDGAVGLGGGISTGAGILAAQAMGADFAYIGSSFIATDEAAADDEYKRLIVAETMAGIVRSRAFTGLDANYLRGSILRMGLDPDEAAESTRSGFQASSVAGHTKAWRDIWGAGHGIGSVSGVVSVHELVERLGREYLNAVSSLRRKTDGGR